MEDEINSYTNISLNLNITPDKSINNTGGIIDFELERYIGNQNNDINGNQGHSRKISDTTQQILNELKNIDNDDIKFNNKSRPDVDLNDINDPDVIDVDQLNDEYTSNNNDNNISELNINNIKKHNETELQEQPKFGNTNHNRSESINSNSSAYRVLMTPD